MAKKIKNSDLIEGSLFAKTIEEANALNAVLDVTEQKFKDVLKVTTKATKNIPKTKKGIDDFTKATRDSRNAVEGLKVVEQQRSKVQKQLQASTDKEIKGKLRLQRANKEQRDALKAEIVLMDKLAGTEEKLLAKNTKLRLERKKLNTTTKQGQQRLKEINAALDRNNKIIDKNSDKLKKQKRNVGNYSSALKGVSGALSSIGLAFGAGALAQNIFSIFTGFEQGGANLASVLGKTSDQINTLTEDAKRLGATTAFTASEVIKLQTEFAKLGFNETEILNATEATLNLAAATGTDLGDAAAIAGSTLGGFGLSAKETGRVTDVMAKSFSTSALDMEKFKESMKTAAPAAKAVGISVEKTTALLGTLANAGISGSKAGNNLKTSLINLNKAGLTLEEGLEKVANAQDKLGAATDLVGKNAAASFLVLAEGRASTDELTEGLENAGGAAKRMADTQLNTLSGKMKLLTSAWEGFILSLDDGDGVLAQVVGTAIELFTELFTLLSGGEKTISDLEAEQARSNKTFNRSIDILKDANQPLEVRERIIEDLNARYGDYLPNLITEKTSMEELTAIQEAHNAASERRLLIAKAQLVQDAAKEQQAERLKSIVALEMNDLSSLSYREQNRLSVINKFEATRLAEVKRLTDEYEAQEAMLQRIINATEDVSGIERGAREGGKPKSRGGEIDEVGKEGNKKRKEVLDEGIGDYLNFIEEDKRLKKERLEAEDQQYELELKAFEAFIQEDKDLKAQRLIDEDQEYERQLTDYENFIQEDKDLKAQRLKDEEAARIQTAQLIEKGADLINDILKKKSKERLDIINAEIKANQEAQKTFAELAANGVVNAKENLAFEKKKEAELAQQKQKEIERAARQELALTAIKTYSGYVQNGEKGAQALQSTVTDIAVLKSFIQGLDFFYEGTEDTGTANNPLDKNGGRLAVLHDNERVMTAEQNKKVSGLTNWELANLGAEYKKGEETVNTAIIADRFQSNADIINKFDALENAINNIDAPNTSFHYDSIKEAFIKTVETKNKIERTINKKSKLF